MTTTSKKATKAKKTTTKKTKNKKVVLQEQAQKITSENESFKKIKSAKSSGIQHVNEAIAAYKNAIADFELTQVIKIAQKEIDEIEIPEEDNDIDNKLFKDIKIAKQIAKEEIEKSISQAKLERAKIISKQASTQKKSSKIIKKQDEVFEDEIEEQKVDNKSVYKKTLILKKTSLPKQIILNLKIE